MPRHLTLISVEAIDLQDGSHELEIDNLRFIIALDGTPVRALAWDQRSPELGKSVHDFSAEDNLADNGSPFVYWSFADVIVYEADRSGSNVGWDGDLDEWIQTVRLDHRDSTQVTIGRTESVSYLLPGRSDCSYKLNFAVKNHPVKVDTTTRDRLRSTKTRSEFVDDGETTGDLAKDKGECRWILAIDGGGLRGIFPLRILEQLESYYRKPCHEMFDMFAGTSTGSIIAAGLATGIPVSELIAFYSDDAIRQQLFTRNQVGKRLAFRYLDLSRFNELDRRKTDLDEAVYAAKLSDWVESRTGEVNRIIDAIGDQLMTPRYRKSGMKEVLYQLLSKETGDGLKPIRLRDCGTPGDTKDILITAWDLHRRETSLFSAFHIPRRVPKDGELARTAIRRSGPRLPPVETHETELLDVVTGLYREVLLKDAVEASASAPVYFSPRARFADGGIGPYNNPAFIAAIEALDYSHIDPRESPVTLPAKYTAYSETRTGKSGTVVWSLGTAFHDSRADSEADAASMASGSLSLNDRTDTVIHWVDEIVDSLMFGASQEQVFLCREVLKDRIKFLRLNVGVNSFVLNNLSDPGDRAKTIESIKLDAVTPEEFGEMDQVAKHFALSARNNRFGFEQGGYEYPERRLSPADARTYASFVRQELQDFE